MMTGALQTAREYLERRYRQLDGEFDGFDSALPVDRSRPCWLPVDSDLRPADSPSPAGLSPGVVLLDREIGISLFLLTYHPRRCDPAAQVERALALQFRLRPGTTGDAAADQHGAWQVVVYWLVEDADLDQWVAQVARLRGETSHFEEVPVDAVVNDGGGWPSALARHGLPRLLLVTRQVLRMHDAGGVLAWSSADQQVRRLMTRFEERFSGKGERALARRLADRAREPSAGDDSEMACAPEPEPLRVLQLSSFRNIRSLEVRLQEQAGTDGPATVVIAGPNGSGKSSLCEALALALCGSSPRYLAFLEGEGLGGTRDGGRYLQECLCPLHSKESPAVVVNGKQRLGDLAVKGQAAAAYRQLSGTLLSQEDRRSLLGMKGPQLAALILGDTSQLAGELLDHCEAGYRLASDRRRGLMRSLGLAAGITKVSSARTRVVERRLAAEPAYPGALVAWLDDERLRPFPVLATGGQLMAEWQSWEESRAEIAGAAAEQQDEGAIAAVIRPWVAHHAALLRRSTALLSEVQRVTSAWPADLEAAIGGWGRWLQGGADTRRTDHQAAGELASLHRRQAELRRRQGEVARRGRLASQHLEHLEGLTTGELLLGEEWQQLHGETCPSCSSDLTARGGVGQVIGELRNRCQYRRDELRAEYRRITEELRDLSNRAASLGGQEPPLTVDQQAAVTAALGWLRPAAAPEQILADPRQRDQVLAVIEALRQVPSPPAPGDEEQVARSVQRLATGIAEAFTDIRETFALPDRWQRVREALQAELTAVLEHHLPQTIGALWHELAMCLTAAPWQLPARPRFDVVRKRGTPLASIRLGEDAAAPVATHILNSAAADGLGLAWFFTNYLISGRFRHAFLVMDDPSQEMDQPTYRDLCRLWAGLLRLHRVHRLPLTLLIFLHQDDRARDAVQATGGTMHTLCWSRGTCELLTSVRSGDQAAPPQPTLRLLSA